MASGIGIGRTKVGSPLRHGFLGQFGEVVLEVFVNEAVAAALEQEPIAAGRRMRGVATQAFPEIA